MAKTVMLQGMHNLTEKCKQKKLDCMQITSTYNQVVALIFAGSIAFSGKLLIKFARLHNGECAYLMHV